MRIKKGDASPNSEGPIQPQKSSIPSPSTAKVSKSVLQGEKSRPSKTNIQADKIEPPTRDEQLKEAEKSCRVLEGKIEEQKEVVESLTANHKEKKANVEDLQKHLQAPDFPEPARENYADILKDAQGELAKVTQSLHKETANLHLLEKALQTVQEKIVQLAEGIG